MSKRNARVWFVTGSSTGFGRALAEAVLRHGDRVVATARKIEQVADLEQRYPDRARAVRLDITDPEEVRTAVEIALGAFGRIDVLVNNAGYGLFGAVEEVSDSQIRKQFETNVFGLLSVTRAVLPLLREQRAGHILNFSSVGGQVSFPGVGIYHATKHAVEGISGSLAQELAPFGVKVTIIEPGFFRTDFGGRSLDFAEPKEPYDFVRQFWAGASERMVGDPVKAAQAIIQVVEAPDPPLRLPLGADALQLIRQKFDMDLKEFERWESVAVATAYSEA